MEDYFEMTSEEEDEVADLASQHKSIRRRKSLFSGAVSERSEQKSKVRLISGPKKKDHIAAFEKKMTLMFR